ncbi:MAG: inositol oxygenase [Terrestrivirus sp.]|uniref:Inositol oxygenase n=1 Tax=Terrestrivirus sp. TaxID=2487775 RepID=A0A3G4ZLZ7_9VIRU|nr:MAG: inositol oxygenase [Terrestrivirus sp.]
MDDISNKKFRDYDDNMTNVAKFYLLNHTYQTYNFVTKMKKKYLDFNKGIKFSLLKAIELLDDIIDDSDPDTKLPQIYHAVQAGEAAREMFPEEKYDWFHLVAFLHDIGKILAHPELFNEPQWAVVGDTFPVGCKFSDKIVFHEYFRYNDDINNEKYNTKYGIYSEGIGFDNITFSWGHDEYAYQVLKHNKCSIPDEGLYIIRYHSFYSHHKERMYNYLASEYDIKMVEWLEYFQKCDLYSKTDDQININININECLPYYTNLLNKYFPNSELEW